MRTRTSRSSVALAALVLAAAASTPLAAQDPAGLELLALPEGRVMMCKMPVEPPEGAAIGNTATGLPVVEREFMFDPEYPTELPPGFPVLAPRTVLAAFDSTGRPLALLDEVSDIMQGGEMAAVVFAPDGRSAGHHMRTDVDSVQMKAAMAAGDLAGAQAAQQPPVMRELTAGEIEQARRLADWLWPRRC